MEPARLTASSTKGSVGGQMSGKGRATLLDKFGTPIVGETIVLIDSGSHVGDPLLWGKALSNGYDAVYYGNRKYKPAMAHATVEPSIF
ncbi:hypothetical protein AQI88_33680 [Streptomyces cellostaticus]|uniref:Uncharacterized protein n=2 Tax=Streptomyces cellostaticus TaxID=67285 RepID=A0A101NFE2_9ACTN|nr:hypothetical protein AQI88_33680 [Streptomyces cellostaticus]